MSNPATIPSDMAIDMQTEYMTKNRVLSLMPALYPRESG